MCPENGQRGLESLVQFLGLKTPASREQEYWTDSTGTICSVLTSLPPCLSCLPPLPPTKQQQPICQKLTQLLCPSCFLIWVLETLQKKWGAFRRVLPVHKEKKNSVDTAPSQPT